MREPRLPAFDRSLFDLPDLDSGALDHASGHVLSHTLMRAPLEVPRRTQGQAAELAHVARVLDTVLDPEVPVVSIRELGIVREIRCEGEHVAVVLTPTYSGCPATEQIEAAVREALEDAGYELITVSYRRAPAWTTDWVTEAGRRKLREYGIAPPAPDSDSGHGSAQQAPVAERPIRIVTRAQAAAVACPRCGSVHTERLSAFGSTACKALFRCLACHEPFEYFKPI